MSSFVICSFARRHRVTLLKYTFINLKLFLIDFLCIFLHINNFLFFKIYFNYLIYGKVYAFWGFNNNLQKGQIKFLAIVIYIAGGKIARKIIVMVWWTVSFEENLTHRICYVYVQSVSVKIAQNIKTPLFDERRIIPTWILLHYFTLSSRKDVKNRDSTLTIHV